MWRRNLRAINARIRSSEEQINTRYNSVNKDLLEEMSVCNEFGYAFGFAEKSYNGVV